MANRRCRGETFPETKVQNCGPIIILFHATFIPGKYGEGQFWFKNVIVFWWNVPFATMVGKCKRKHLLKMTGIPWQVLCHDPAIVGWQEELGAPYYGG